MFIIEDLVAILDFTTKIEWITVGREVKLF